ncbi:hypothetical protein ACN469_11565 [Corallococcus terminator]
MKAHRKEPSRRETSVTKQVEVGGVADGERGGNGASGKAGLARPTHGPRPQV